MTDNPRRVEILTQFKQQIEAPTWPEDTDAEEALIGAILFLPECLPHIAGLVVPDDFYITRFGWIFQAILDVWHGGQQVDYLTVIGRLRDTGRLEEVGGGSVITNMINHTPTMYHAKSYAQRVQHAADRRRLIGVMGTAVRGFVDQGASLNALYSETMQAFIQAKPRSLDVTLTLGRTVSDRFLALQSREEGDVTVFPLPFAGCQVGLPYLTGGKLFGIGGDEKTGKSALAETLSEHWSKLGLRGFYIHTEETPDDKINRRYSRWSGIPFMHLEAGKLNDEEKERRARAIELTVPWEHNLDMYYESLPTQIGIMTLMLRAVQVFKCKYIVLDNFTDVQFVDVPRGSSNAVEAIRLLQQLNDFAAKYKVLVVVTTQMSTQDSGKRIAYGTSGFNKKMSWFWDINRKPLKEPLTYHADGRTFNLDEGEFDPRVDIYQPAVRYGRAVKIPMFADLRRYYWRDRDEVRIIETKFPPVDLPVLLRPPGSTLMLKPGATEGAFTVDTLRPAKDDEVFRGSKDD